MSMTRVQLPADIITHVLQYVSIVDLQKSMLLVSKHFYNGAKQTIQNRKNWYIFTGPFYHDDKYQFELFHKAQSPVNLVWSTTNSTRLHQDGHFVYCVDQNLVVHCYMIENPDVLVWSVPILKPEERLQIKTILQFAQDKNNLYIVLGDRSTWKAHCYAIQKATSKLTKFHISPNPNWIFSASPYMNTTLIILLSFIVVRDTKTTVYNKNLKVHKKQMHIVKNYDHIHIQNESNGDQDLYYRADRTGLTCYRVDTGQILYNFPMQGRQSNTYDSYMYKTHWCYPETDTLSTTMAAVVDIETREGFELANPEAYYLAETSGDHPRLVGFCKVDAFYSGEISYYTYDQQREKSPQPAKWVIFLEDMKGRYHPDVQIKVINNESTLLALVNGQVGCFLFTLDITNGSLLWKHIFFSGKMEQFKEFASLFGRMNMKVLEHDQKTRIIVHGTIRDYGFMVKEFDSNGAILLDICTPWKDYHAQIANLPQHEFGEPLIQHTNQSNVFEKIKKLFK
jgi:hypothetical protein